MALNAEPSLKSAKITVSPDEEVVYLTGVTVTDAQRQKAMEIAKQFAGEGKVANAITTEQVVMQQNPAPEAAVAEATATPSATAMPQG